jgi:hypothetical protein
MTQPPLAHCLHCGRSYLLPTGRAGQTVRRSTYQTAFLVAETSPAPSATPPPLPYQAMAATPRSSGSAIAAVICGAVGICYFPCPILGIIFAIIVLAKAKSPQVPSRRNALIGLVLGGVWILLLFFGAAILPPTLNRARPIANRARSQDNLKVIRNNLMRYEYMNSNQLSPDRGTLAFQFQIPPQIFVDPSSNTMPPQNWFSMTEQQKIDWVNQNSDYVLVGGSRGIPAPTSMIVYDKDSNHCGDGCDILMGNGTVEWLPPKQRTPGK